MPVARNCLCCLRYASRANLRSANLEDGAAQLVRRHVVRLGGNGLSVDLDSAPVDETTAFAVGGRELDVGEQLGQVHAAVLGVFDELDVEGLDVLGHLVLLELAVERGLCLVCCLPVVVRGDDLAPQTALELVADRACPRLKSASIWSTSETGSWVARREVLWA